VKDWKLAYLEKGEYYGEYAASLALMSARLVMKDAGTIKPENEEGLRILLEALISCGVAMSIAGSSRPCSGSEHLFSHALDVIRPNHSRHGEQCGVGTIMMAYLHGLNWRHIKDTLRILGAPTKASELDVEKDDLLKALEMAASIRPERYTILNKLKLDREMCEKIAQATEVI
jgi:glycerol-1-phosphate dehydrogenase [NAD(P)+]